MKIKRAIQIFMVLIFAIRPLYAQKREFGLSFGYGKTDVEYYGRPFMHPFSDVKTNYAKLGFEYCYSPTNAIFSISLGLDYVYRGNSVAKLNYLRTPIGLDFSFGEQFYFNLGGGLYGSALIWSSGFSNDSDFQDTKSTFQFGWYGNIGFGIKITEIHCIELLFRQYSDITKMYEYYRTSPGGAPYYLDKKGYDGLIRICLKYTIK